MPRVSRAETERNRVAIEQASSRLFRERGLAVSVADLMREVGLTHGGFYGHFPSKDQLAAIACQLAFADSAQRWAGRVAGATDTASARRALVEGYLTANNRAAQGSLCPMATLAVDVSREPSAAPVTDAFAAGVESLLQCLAQTQSAAQGSTEARTAALADLSTLVGALVLARATRGRPLSDEVLDAARHRLLADPASAAVPA